MVSDRRQQQYLEPCQKCQFSGPTTARLHQSPGRCPPCFQPALQLKSERGRAFSALATHCNHLGRFKAQQSDAWVSHQIVRFDGSGIHPRHQNFKPGYVSGTREASKTCQGWAFPLDLRNQNLQGGLIISNKHLPPM